MFDFSSTMATCPYGFVGVASKNAMSPAFGTERRLLLILVHHVPSGDPDFHALSADHENQRSGILRSSQYFFTHDTHWYQY